VDATLAWTAVGSVAGVVGVGLALIPLVRMHTRAGDQVPDPDMPRQPGALFEGQGVDRYAKAIEQLGSEMLDVRVGSIYALERTVQDSTRDHQAVVETLAVCIREHSRDRRRPSEVAGRDQERRPRPDVQAALTVSGTETLGAIPDPLISPARISGARISHRRSSLAWISPATNTLARYRLPPSCGESRCRRCRGRTDLPRA
jgi:hypothetical protein